MLENFNDMSPMKRVITILLVLIAVWIAVRIVLGILAALMPLIIIACVVVGGLWLFEKVRD